MSEVKRTIKTYSDGQLKEKSVYKDGKLAEVVSYLPGNKVKQVIKYHDNGKMSNLIQVNNDNMIVQVFNRDEKLDGFGAYEEYIKGNIKLLLSYTNGKFGHSEVYLDYNYVEITDDNDIRCNIGEEGKLRSLMIEDGIKLEIDDNGVVTSPDNLKGKFQFVVEGERVVKKKLS